MRVAIGSDRRGFDYKSRLMKHMRGTGHDPVDVGPYDDSLPVDYPIYAQRVGELVASGECDRGVVVCATGIGVMIAANKVRGVRCGIAYTDEVARLMREHNDANVVAFGQDQMAYGDVARRLDIFLASEFAAGYHCSRVKQLADMEEGVPISQTPMQRKF